MQQTLLIHRLSRGGTHLVFSLFVVVLVALWVFGVWYPSPFRDLSGGLHLFGILIGVDLLLGPLATMVVSKPGKSQREWRMDVALIVALQFAALGYGVWTMYQARPVYLAFEIDRLRAVTAVDVVTERLPMAPVGLQALPMTGPSLVAVRPFASPAEGAEATMAALQGVELGFRPDFWMPYEKAKDAILKAAKPLAELTARKPNDRALLTNALTGKGTSPADALYLPLHGRDKFWTVLLSPVDAKPIGFAAVDPYD